MNYFVTAIGTDCGKTVVSAILCEALRADYWKPVQAGLPRDTDTVKGLVSNPTTVFHDEQFLLKTPASPHAAAKIDGMTVDLHSFILPHTSNDLIIEGAGGCLVPLNNSELVVDLISRFGTEAIVVSNHYLGSINHTLMTIEALINRRIPIKGIIFNGDANAETERIILHRTRLKCLLRINKEPSINRQVIKMYADLLNEKWNG